MIFTALSDGRFLLDERTTRCALGKGGVIEAAEKREGDGKSPIGRFRLLSGWWRPDRRLPPRTGLALKPLRRDLGWCDAPGHGRYNRLIRLPFSPSHEEMWRADHQYDVVLDIDWNRRCRRQGRGSAIFFHLMNDTRTGTAGCVAVPAAAIDRVMARIGPKTRIEIR